MLCQTLQHLTHTPLRHHAAAAEQFWRAVRSQDRAGVHAFARSRRLSDDWLPARAGAHETSLRGQALDHGSDVVEVIGNPTFTDEYLGLVDGITQECQQDCAPIIRRA